MIYGREVGGPTTASAIQEMQDRETRNPGVSQAIERLQKLTAVCEENSSRLFQRLDPILNNHPRPASTEKANPSNGCCSLASAIHQCCDQLDRLALNTQEVIDRCEV
jgi:hypothetical protein